MIVYLPIKNFYPTSFINEFFKIIFVIYYNLIADSEDYMFFRAIRINGIIMKKDWCYQLIIG